MRAADLLAMLKAGSAIPLLWEFGSAVCVLCCIFVTLGAMCYRSTSLNLKFHRLFEPGDSYRWSAVNVFFSGDRLQMCRIYAASHAAKMIQVETLRNRADEGLIAESMCQLRIARIIAPHLQASIASLIELSSPQPAAAIRFRRHKAHDAFLYWYSRSTHVISYQIAMVRAARCFRTALACFNYSAEVSA